LIDATIDRGADGHAVESQFCFCQRDAGLFSPSLGCLALRLVFFLGLLFIGEELELLRDRIAPTRERVFLRGQGIGAVLQFFHHCLSDVARTL
jgi:hypothetical protein